MPPNWAEIVEAIAAAGTMAVAFSRIFFVLWQIKHDAWHAPELITMLARASGKDGQGIPETKGHWVS